jgi:hypothetical protein
MNYRRTSPQSNLTDSTVAEIRLMGLRGISESEIARTFSIHRKTVYNILQNNTWNHVPAPVRAYGFSDYLVFPDGRIYSTVSDSFITQRSRSDGVNTVRVRTSGGQRVTTPVATLVAKGYLGSRSRNPQVTYIDGNPANAHFTNIQL